MLWGAVWWHSLSTVVGKEAKHGGKGSQARWKRVRRVGEWERGVWGEGNASWQRVRLVFFFLMLPVFFRAAPIGVAMDPELCFVIKGEQARACIRMTEASAVDEGYFDVLLPVRLRLSA